jgi:glycosyltransferase involved in cell wall biosynthesis
MLAAGGILYKIYDAMHIGIPVVSTSVANQGIDAIHGQHILLADNAQDFAEHVVDLLRDDHLYARLSENSERFINEKFDWERSVRDVEDLYSYLAQK